MLAILSRRLHSWARGWLILALVAGFMIFEAITLPRLQAAPGGGIVSLDAQLFYRPEQAFATVAAYGEARRFWIVIYLTWDIANPILYTAIFGLLISWFFRRGFRAESRLQRLNLLPVAAGLCDLLENLCIVMLLALYPAQPAAVAWLSTICTVSKIGFLSVSMLLILVGLVVIAIKALSRSRVRKTLLVAALLLFAGAVCYSLATHEIVRCYR
jgi:hypothetical protein